MKLSCCFHCKRVLIIPNQEICYCKHCRKGLRNILSINIKEDMMQSTLDQALKILEQLTKRIENILVRTFWYHIQWPERLAFYVALIQSYIRKEEKELWYEQKERVFSLSSLTRKVAIFYLLVLEKALYEFIDIHIAGFITYTPYELLNPSKSDLYIKEILNELRKTYEILEFDFERALLLHRDLLIFLRDNIKVKRKENIFPFISFLSDSSSGSVSLEELQYKGIDYDMSPFQKEYFDMDLLFLLERGRDLLHQSGPFLFDYTFHVKWDKGEVYKPSLQKQFFNLLSENALNINSLKIWTFPSEFSFRKLLTYLTNPREYLTFFTTSSPMTFKDFIKTEVIERKNYTFQEIKEWAKFYSLDADTRVIWVSPFKWVAWMYILPASEHDTVESIPESEMDVDEITSEVGYIIKESNDGDHGYLFVYI